MSTCQYIFEDDKTEFEADKAEFEYTKPENRST
jgi:hypothetical protein